MLRGDESHKYHLQRYTGKGVFVSSFICHFWRIQRIDWKAISILNSKRRTFFDIGEVGGFIEPSLSEILQASHTIHSYLLWSFRSSHSLALLIFPILWTSNSSSIKFLDAKITVCLLVSQLNDCKAQSALASVSY